MVAAQQLGNADQRGVGERPALMRGDGGLALDVGQHLPPALVHAEQAGSPVEADALEVPEQRMHGRAARAHGAPYGVPDPADQAGVREAPGQQHLAIVTRHRRHAESSRARAVAEWVTRLLT